MSVGWGRWGSGPGYSAAGSSLLQGLLDLGPVEDKVCMCLCQKDLSNSQKDVRPHTEVDRV